MSKLLYFLLLALFAFTLNIKMKTETKCMKKGDDCDFTAWCCGKLVCKDYRCSKKGTKDNQVEWAPKGEKCDYGHHCKDNYKCESHRCVINNSKIIKKTAKSISGDF